MSDDKQKTGAGVLFVAPEDRALFLKRGDGGDHAGEWCIPGGHRDGSETATETAHREAEEEVGPHPEGDLILWTRRLNDGGMDFTTFVQRVDHMFPVKLSDEHVDWVWADIKRPPEPLHPGCKIALDRFFLDELGVARAMAGGELTSPQRYLNIWLFDLRITGTGGAYRNALKEHVWRRPEEYLTKDFLARCNGLPVIWEHPDGSVLNSKEYKERNIGTVFLPYIKGEEVWGIAKIFDDTAVEEMRSRQVSTSPGVLGVGNNREDLGDGTSVLVEENPDLLDHVAVCDLGVWDTDGVPKGVSSSTTGEYKMAESEKTAEELEAAKRADSEALNAKKEEPDKLLAALDTAMSKLDAACAKMDAMNEEKAKEDAHRQAKKDRKKARKDRMDALSARRDSGEISEEETKELEGMEGKGGETMADKKDSEKEDEEERKDGEEEMAADRKDSQKKVADALDRLASLERVVAGPSKEDEAAMVDAQARCDQVAQLFNDSAPRPMQGEGVLAFRKRLVKPFAKHNLRWKEANLAVLDAQAFAIAEEDIYASAAMAARNPTDLKPLELREIRRVDPDTGHRIREFYGDSDACWGGFKSPVRKAKNGLNSFISTPSNVRH